MRVRFLRTVLLVAAWVAATPAAFAQTPSAITFTYPALPAPGVPDDDGYLVQSAQTFQEGGMHVESFWITNSAPVFSSAAHSHVHFPNPFEMSHGFASGGVGPDRMGLYLRREDGGPFDLVSLDLRLVQPSATNFLIGTSLDPALPVTSQLTAFPIAASAGFQQLTPPGFSGVTQLFMLYDLGTPTTDRGDIDNVIVSFPTGSCSQSVPGGVVQAHDGLADPTTEGWTAEGAGTGVTVGPVNDGIDAWEIDDNSAAAGSSRTYSYYPPPDVMCWARSSGFTLRSKLRAVDLPDAVDGSVLMSFSDSTQLYEVRIGQNSLGHPIVWLSNTTATLNGLDSGYHTYELVYHPTTRSVDLRVDGTTVLANRAGLAQNVAAPRVRFGSAYDSGTGNGHFARVELALPPRCSNGVDDDGDGRTDYPADAGCTSADDDSEHEPTLPCDDGIDNDGDGLVDFPADPGCTSPTDTTETSACDDGIDNDGDGLIDFPADPGCDGANDDSERSASLPCDDGTDNDGDGLVDFPADPGCQNALSPIENPKCQNGIDDDSDGGIDFDGGAAANGGAPLGAADPQCAGKPWRNRETAGACGLGADLALLLPMIAALRRRARR